MQRAKEVQFFGQDSKEAISEVKKDAYKRELETGHSLVAFGITEHKIRTDFQLTRNDRFQLLAEVERAATLAG